MDDHLRDIKKNIRKAAETSQGPTAPTGFIGRQRLATSATASNTLTWQMHDGAGYVSIMDLDTSGDNVSRWYARKGSMPGEAISGTLSGVSVVSSFFDGSATGTFRGFFTGTASGVLKGQLLANDGSSSAPGMAFANDTNTGWLRSGNNAAVLVTGASKRIKAESDGRFSGPSLGGWEHLDTQTASAAAQLDFTANISSTYDLYAFVLSDILLSVDDELLRLRVSTDGGATFVSTASYDVARRSIGQADVTANGQTFIFLNYTNLGNGADEGCSGIVYMRSPAGSQDTHFSWQFDEIGTTANFTHSDGGGSYRVTTAVDAVRFFTSGTFSGVISCYGVRKN